MKAVFSAILYPENSSYRATVPDVPGCITSGRNLTETIDNITDALHACLCVLEDEGEKLPSPTPPENLPLSGNAFIALVEVDTLNYRIKTDNRAVRKNVSMPAWMASLADKQGLNCSQLLQEAIQNRLNC